MKQERLVLSNVLIKVELPTTVNVWKADVSSVSQLVKTCCDAVALILVTFLRTALLCRSL